MWGILKLENARKKENDYICISFLKGMRFLRLTISDKKFLEILEKLNKVAISKNCDLKNDNNKYIA